MKRLIFCFDGTWNRLSASTPTNVVLTAASIFRIATDGTAQIIHYDDGVGTGRLEHWSGGMMGAGLTQNIREAYRFLIFNYDPGDEIFVFGFSRGAFSAQTFVGFVRHVGTLRRLHAAQIDQALKLYEQRLAGADGSSELMREFRSKYANNVCIDSQDDAWRCSHVDGYQTGAAPLLKIKYLGIWDTVAALGVPEFVPFSGWLNRDTKFHNTRLDEFVESARHAVAIDERRTLFPPTLWGDLTPLNATKNVANDDKDAPYQEKWFPGVHGSIGGGGDIRGLSDCALSWVLKGAKRAGLKLDIEQGSRIQEFKPDALAPLVNEKAHTKGPTDYLLKDRVGPEYLWQLSSAAIRRWKAPASDLPEKKLYRPKTLERVALALDSYRDLADGGEQDLITTHVVMPGDQLRKLALRYYGDATKWVLIFDANRDLIDDYDELFLGWKLRIPVALAG